MYIATGHFIWSETDITLKGRPTLAVTRTYNSHDPRVGLLGNSWSMSCDSTLLYTVSSESSNSTTTTVREFVRKLSNGKRYTYSEQADGTFTAPGLFDVVTRQADNTGRLQRRDGSYSVYSELGRLVSDVDRNGNAINYTYDTQGRLTQKADTHGRSLSYEYNTNGLVSIIRDHTGRQWQYNYDVDANLISVTDPLNGARQYAYEAYQAAGDGHTYQHLIRVTDETGAVETEVTYNNERVATYKEYENTFTYQFDTANRRATKTDSQGSRWVFSYNETGQYTQIEKPLNRTEIYDRDENSLVTRFVDASGAEYFYTYDQYSNQLTEVDERGTIATTYDNEKPWPLTMTTRSGRVTTVTYNDNGNPLTITDPSNAVTRLVWTTQGDLQQITNTLNNQISMSYNSQGVPLTVTDALERTTQYEYDERNNNRQISNPAGEVIRYQFDLLDRITAVTDGNGDTTTYAYDAADRIIQVTAPNGQTVQYSYDNFGRLNQRIFYDGSTYQYSYRTDNLINQITRPNGVITTIDYDDAKRMTRRTLGNEDTYSYTYNLRDEVTSIANNSGTVTLAYDDFGRRISETVNGQTSNYQFNSEDEATQIVGLGVTQNHQFDSRGLLNQLSVNGTVNQYTFDAVSQLTQLDRSNVTNTTFGYDNANQLATINHGAAQRNYQYVYDDAKRVSQWQGIAGETRNYSYDNASRLIGVQSPNIPETFTYDSMGNRQNGNAQFDVANRLTEDDNFAYTYDVNGNRTQKINKTTGETERYTYNGLDQLVRYQAYPNSDLTTAPTTDYSYTFGPLGRRWSKQNNLGSEVTQFYWSGAHLVGESSNGILRRYILEGATPIAFIENGEIYHYLKDHLGTAHEIIDDAGNLVWQGDYGSFGKVLVNVGTVDNNLRYPGQYFDSETNLHYNHYRTYDPQTGRYLTTDPRGILLDFSDPQRVLAF
ncbi:MAG: RHS domain-containing protein, partial [Cellvibrionaceae bacterium]|nr:RHS domain-containing protein [Cellvibrionaceae bacterium]